MQEDKIENSVYWIWLSKTKLMAHREKIHALRQGTQPKDIYLSLVCDGEQALLNKANHITESHQKLNIHMITPNDALYKEGMPIVTYFRGTPHQGKQIAIVGTRNPSVEGRIIAEIISNQYIENNYSINSGLAVGIDTITHLKALELKGITQAFVAHGLDRCYPKKHQIIFDQIMDRGCIYSQYEVGIEAERFRFLERNALMVHMSDEVFVVEAGEKSGALNTGLTALKYSKMTFSTRGPEDSYKCAGNHRLISSGAIPIDFDDQLMNRPADSLCTLLRSQHMTFDAIQQMTNLSTTDLHLQLLELENQKWINLRADGKWHYNGW